MRDGLRVRGHPVHPMLIAFPIGLLMLAPVWDALGWIRDEPMWWAIGFWTSAAGLALGVLASVAGFVDLLALPDGSRAGRVAVNHMMVMCCALGAFFISVMLRNGVAALHGGKLATVFALDAFGCATLVVGGWLGGELVFRHGVGHVRSREAGAEPPTAGAATK
jgi:uncharacterized membrane protein